MNPSYNAGLGMAPQMPIMSSRGDVVLPASETKKPKKWLLVGLGVAGTLIIVLVILMVVMAGKNGGARGRLESLVGYIEDGKEGTDALELEGDDALNSAIFAVRISVESQEKVGRYYERLAAMKEAFLSSVTGKIDERTLEAYNAVLKMLIGAVNRDGVWKAIMGVYDEKGMEAAAQYYNDNYACGIDAPDDDVIAICANESNYYMSLASEYEFYRRAGCVVGGDYDAGCAVEYYGRDFWKGDDMSQMVAYYGDALASEAMLLEISEIVRNANIGMKELVK